MSDFQPGDVVVCVDDRAPLPGAERITKGSNYRIAETITWRGKHGIHLTGGSLGPRDWWRAERFRKIDAETTEEFRVQMRSLGKVRERTDA